MLFVIISNVGISRTVESPMAVVSNVNSYTLAKCHICLWHWNAKEIVIRITVTAAIIARIFLPDSPDISICWAKLKFKNLLVQRVRKRAVLINRRSIDIELINLVRTFNMFSFLLFGSKPRLIVFLKFASCISLQLVFCLNYQLICGVPGRRATC